MFFTVSMLICIFSSVQTSFISEKINSLGGGISTRQTQTELDHLEDIISTRYILLVNEAIITTHSGD